MLRTHAKATVKADTKNGQRKNYQDKETHATASRIYASHPEDAEQGKTTQATATSTMPRTRNMDTAAWERRCENAGNKLAELHASKGLHRTRPWTDGDRLTPVRRTRRQ